MGTEGRVFACWGSFLEIARRGGGWKQGNKKNLWSRSPVSRPTPVSRAFKRAFPQPRDPSPHTNRISHPLTRRRRSSPPPRFSPSACWLPFVFPVSPYDQPYSSYSALICSNLGLCRPIRLGLVSIWGSMQARGLWIRLVWVEDFLGPGLRIGALIRRFCD